MVLVASLGAWLPEHSHRERHIHVRKVLGRQGSSALLVFLLTPRLCRHTLFARLVSRLFLLSTASPLSLRRHDLVHTVTPPFTFKWLVELPSWHMD